VTGREDHWRPRRRAVVAVAALLMAVVGLAAVLVGSGRLGVDEESGDGNGGGGPRAAWSGPADPEPAARLTEDLLLLPAQVTAVLPGRTWRAAGADDNTGGTGLRVVCQQARFADPAGLTALVRTTTAGGLPAARVTQIVELSGSVAAARAAYRRTVAWFAGCSAPRVQLLGAYRVDGVGDRATLLTLRQAGKEPATLGVGVAQVRDLTTTVVLRGAGPVPADRAARLLATAAARLCPQDQPLCSRPPRLVPVAPPPTGEAPGTLGLVDLPAAAGVTAAWFGVDPVPARRTNPARTACDRADFSGPGVQWARSRTYLVPDAPLPPRFGLTQTVAAFRSPSAAAGFLAGVRDSVGACEDRELSTTVSSGPDVPDPGRGPAAGAERVSWTLDTEVAESRSVRIRVGFARSGRFVAQVTFVSGDAEDLTDDQLDALLVRAGQRLHELER
jgi:PknH-like protein